MPQIQILDQTNNYASQEEAKTVLRDDLTDQEFRRQ